MWGIYNFVAYMDVELFAFREVMNRDVWGNFYREMRSRTYRNEVISL